MSKSIRTIHVLFPDTEKSGTIKKKFKFFYSEEGVQPFIHSSFIDVLHPGCMQPTPAGAVGVDKVSF